MSHGKEQQSTRTLSRFTAAVLSIAILSGIEITAVQSGEGTDFPGTVLTVDQASGKFAVKKEGSGTRFTFSADEKTVFTGPGLASIKDLKKDDHVVVTYHVEGAKYLASRVARK